MLRRGHTVAMGAVGALMLSACGDRGTGSPTAPPTTLSARAQAGRALFFDVSLSASGAQSCGTCHVPARAFTADPATDLSADAQYRYYDLGLCGPFDPPATSGAPDLYQYNDLPVAFDGNVNVGEIPYTPPAFAGGQAPTLDASEIDAVVTFLCTLTDGYDPNNPAAYDVPAQCLPGAP